MAEPTSLTEMLDRLEAASPDAQDVDFGDIVAVLGRRSFAPLLLLGGLVVASPLSGIPGVPTMIALFVALIAVQLCFGVERFWLPRWLMRRSVDRWRFNRVLKLLRRPARVVDRWTRPRWTRLTGSTGTRVVAALCLVVAVAMPPLELVPFAATGAGIVLSIFGLALITHDGAIELVAVMTTVVTLVAAGAAVT